MESKIEVLYLLNKTKINLTSWFRILFVFFSLNDD